jgi:hypothetical protein
MTTPVDKPEAVDISQEAFEGVREDLRDIMSMSVQGGWIEARAAGAIAFMSAQRDALTARDKQIELLEARVRGVDVEIAQARGSIDSWKSKLERRNRDFTAFVARHGEELARAWEIHCND